MNAIWSFEGVGGELLISVWGHTNVQRELDGVSGNRSIYEAVSLQRQGSIEPSSNDG